MFVREIIKTGLSGRRRRVSSFQNIYQTLKQYDFAIVPGVASKEVLSFVGLKS
jgi:hypothetical protein